MRLDYKEQYKMGAENRVIDALSRQNEGVDDIVMQETSRLMTISTTTPMWMREVAYSYKRDRQALKLLVQTTIE